MTATKLPTEKVAARRAAEAFFAAHEAEVAAKAAKAEAKAKLLAVLGDARGSVDLPDARGAVEVSTVEKRNFDVAALAKLLPAEVFAEVTEPVVVAPLWDAALRQGKVSAKALKAVSTTEGVRVAAKAAR